MDAQTEQRMTALAAANEVRTKRRQLKERMAVGEEDARALLAEPPDLIGTVEIGDFLTWVPKVGREKSKAITFRARVSPSRLLINLTPVERSAVAQQLPGPRVTA